MKVHLTTPKALLLTNFHVILYSFPPFSLNINELILHQAEQWLALRNFKCELYLRSCAWKYCKDWVHYVWLFTHILSDTMLTKTFIRFVNQACPFAIDVSKPCLRMSSVANLAERDLSEEAGRPVECVSMEMEEKYPCWNSGKWGETCVKPLAELHYIAHWDGNPVWHTMIVALPNNILDKPRIFALCDPEAIIGMV